MYLTEVHFIKFWPRRQNIDCCLLMFIATGDVHAYKQPCFDYCISQSSPQLHSNSSRKEGRRMVLIAVSLVCLRPCNGFNNRKKISTSVLTVFKKGMCKKGLALTEKQKKNVLYIPATTASFQRPTSLLSYMKNKLRPTLLYIWDATL